MQKMSERANVSQNQQRSAQWAAAIEKDLINEDDVDKFMMCVLLTTDCAPCVHAMMKSLELLQQTAISSPFRIEILA